MSHFEIDHFENGLLSKLVTSKFIISKMGHSETNHFGSEQLQNLNESQEAILKVTPFAEVTPSFTGFDNFLRNKFLFLIPFLSYWVVVYSPPHADGGEMVNVVKSVTVKFAHSRSSERRFQRNFEASPTEARCLCETLTEIESSPQSTDNRSLQTDS